MERILIFLCFPLFVLFSCAGIKGQEEIPVPDDPVKRGEMGVSKALDEGNYTKALSLVYHYRDEQGLESPLWEDWEDQSLKDMVALLSRSLEEKNYPLALSLERSLSLLGLSKNEAGGEQEIYRAYVRHLINYERSGAAAALVSLGLPRPSFWDDEDLVFLASAFLKGENRGALMIIREEMKGRGLEIASEVYAFLDKEVPLEKLVTGTVTVWVDRGLKLEHGAGSLDRSIGSGFFIDKKGYILTNYHVIESEVNPEYQGYSRLFIKLSDNRGEKIPARVVGWDRHYDIALLKTGIEAPYVFSFAGNRDFFLGEEIFTIGSPGGLHNSITSGKVSALNRRLQSMSEAVQIDVPVNPGNSGGPLLDVNHEVKGIVFAGIADFEGVNFAIDGLYVKTLLPALYEGGGLKSGWMGIGAYAENGKLEVLYVMPGSPADLAGLKRGDLIRRVNRRELSRVQSVRDSILGWREGALVLLDWEREGQPHSSLLALAQRPDVPLKKAVDRDTRENLIPPLFGMVLSKVGRKGYTVEKVYTGSIADEASIGDRDVVSLKKWYVDKKEGYVLIFFIFKGIKAGYLESVVRLGAGLESDLFF